MKARTLVFALLVTLAGSCSYQKLEFEKESGRINKVKKGDKFRVSLPEDHHTTYLWAFKKDIPVNKADYMGSVFHGTYVDFNFTAAGRGVGELTFYLYRAADTAQVKRYLVEIE